MAFNPIKNEYSQIASLIQLIFEHMRTIVFLAATIIRNGIRCEPLFLSRYVSLTLAILVLAGGNSPSVQAAGFPPPGKNPVRVVALGDSVVWGQGLLEHEKFSSLVGEMMTACKPGLTVERIVLAHSGAIIGKDDTVSFQNLHGEVPSPFPTIRQQCARFDQSPETVDLVILDGGINDVDVDWILDPFVKTETLRVRTQEFCLEDMSVLLQRVTSKFANAKIVVTGYYQIVSDQTSSDGFDAFSDVFGIITWLLEDSIIENCRTFAQESRNQLQRAVANMNQELVGRGEQPRVFFADPGFGDQNAAFASASWLFGLRTDLFPPLDYLRPLDAMAELRKTVCGGDFICERASVGHPNPEGSRAYAYAIMSALFSWVDISSPCLACGNGRFESPFGSLANAIANLPPGGIVKIKGSATAETLRITKSCVLESCGGVAVIGEANPRTR